MFKRICFFSLIVCLSFNVKAQSISEILLHFPEKEMDVPMDIREKMVEFNGNTKGDYDNYKLVIYDKRARFIRIVTPLEVIYEVSVWKLESDTLLVALCETRCGISCGSKSSSTGFIPPPTLPVPAMYGSQPRLKIISPNFNWRISSMPPASKKITIPRRISSRTFK